MVVINRKNLKQISLECSKANLNSKDAPLPSSGSSSSNWPDLVERALSIPAVLSAARWVQTPPGSGRTMGSPQSSTRSSTGLQKPMEMSSRSEARRQSAKQFPLLRTSTASWPQLLQSSCCTIKSSMERPRPCMSSRRSL